MSTPDDVLDPGVAGELAIRGSALRTIGYGVGLLMAAGSAPFMVRHLGVADFGRYVLVTALVSLVGGLTEVGVLLVGTREYSTRGGTERDRMMQNLLGVRIVMSTVGAIAAVAFTLLAGYDRTLVLGAVLAGTALIVQSIQGLLFVPLIARLRLGWATAAELVRQGLVAAGTLALVLGGASLLPFFGVALLAAAGSLVLTVALVRGSVPFRPSFDVREWWWLLRGTLAIGVAVAVNVTYFRIAIVIMSLLTTALETGYFAASFRILEVLLPIPALLIGSVFPILSRAARDDADRLAYVTRRIFDVALIAGGGLVLLLEIAAPLLVDVLAGDAGEPAVAVLRIQAFALLLIFLSSGAGVPLVSLHRHRAVLLANVMALLLAVGLLLLLVPALGAEGAALAMVLSELALATSLYVPLLRALPELELSPRPVCSMLAAAAPGACALLIPAPVVVRAALAAALYLGVLFLVRAVPPELTSALLRRRPSAETRVI